MEIGHHSMEELISHAPGLQALAVRLVGPCDAEDLVQETWLKAAHNPPLKEVPAGPWLVRVLLNGARTAVRRRTLRNDHHAAAQGEPARNDEAPSPSDLTEAFEAAERLLEAIQKLPSQQQAIITLRYFRGQDSTSIGRTLEISPSTARWHIREAVQRLRAVLATQCGDGAKGWAFALAPLTQLKVGATLPGAITVKSHAFLTSSGIRSMLVCLAAAGAVLVATILSWPGERLVEGPDPSSNPAGTLAQFDQAEVLSIEGPTQASLPRGGDKNHRSDPVEGSDIVPTLASALSEPFSQDPTAAVKPAPPHVVRIVARLCTPAGVGVSGAQLSLADAPQITAVADSDGYCELRITGPARGPDSPIAQIRSAGFVIASHGPELRSFKPLGLLVGVDASIGDIVLLPCSPLCGVVRTPAGDPLSGARVSRLDAGPTDAAITNSRGEFLLQHVEHEQVRVTAPGYLSREVTAGKVRNRRDLTLVLQEDPDASILSVLVTGPDHHPLANALVEVYAAPVESLVFRTDAQGLVHSPLPHSRFSSVRCWDNEGQFAITSLDHVMLNGERQVIQLGRSATQRIQVNDGHGQPVDGFAWTFLPSGLEPLRTPRSGIVANGHTLDLAVSPLKERSGPSGSLIVEVPGHHFQGVTIPAGAPGAWNVPIQVDAGETRLLSGTVVAENAPVANALVQLIALPWHNGSVPLHSQGGGELARYASRTDDNGRFTIPPPSIGSFLFAVTADGFAPFISDGQASAVATAPMSVELKPGGTLLGSLVRGGKPERLDWMFRWTDHYVDCIHEGGEQATTSVDAQGKYRLVGLAPGTWTVQLRRVNRRDETVLIGAPMEIEIIEGALASQRQVVPRN